MKSTFLIVLCCFVFACSSESQPTMQASAPFMASLKENSEIVTGAEQMDRYIGLLQNKKVGLVVNHTSVIGDQHLADVLVEKGVTVGAIFAPEHGFRGEAANGEHVASGIDGKTGLPVRSLYGKTKKPTPEMLADIDILVFDIQDVGARFYTYLSTLYYIIEAGAENKIPVIVLDRPNPNGFYVDGPVLEPSFTSFVGIIPIPVVHGMTLGELAKMICGENWMTTTATCDLQVIACKHYQHDDLYALPINPSPNLSSQSAIYLYPTLCLFEPTKISIGRGTPFPFEVIGYPENQNGSFQFTPAAIAGKVTNPKYEGKACNGQNLGEFGSFYFKSYRHMYLPFILDSYKFYPDKSKFFTDAAFFDKLAGTDKLRKQIIAGNTEEEIRASWAPDLQAFKEMRKKYLLYPDPLN
ncbi:MAG: DUF1343 domain-containing protein [Cryomorphaceae bacterium]|nr:DUF1343 domain-containing protein [Cryomorphaceae bacterium]